MKRIYYRDYLPPTTVPGALTFMQHAARLGVTVIYLTNPRAVVEDATLCNLVDLGFPISDQADVILTRGENPQYGSWILSCQWPRIGRVCANYEMR